ncbi:PREDICTED: uncharacterized protein LOC109344680 [Lupinus angustifolius]|uniref:uncharacterized protein LOC109344680 n=1 Tax=Lupinus angustifolius TaxID=3871 RepID=UPI00092E7AEB|nr:PREDICTED: uncharacterized protein LOC109344680 [Lupinus angustifolius]
MAKNVASFVTIFDMLRRNVPSIMHGVKGKGCLSYRRPTNAERRIYLGDGKSMDVEICIPISHEKSKSLDVFKSFKTEVENQLNKRIKCVKSDCGGEYYGRYEGSGEQYLGPFGIVPQYTMLGSPSMNGVAKIRNQTFKAMVRSMICHSILPVSR